MARRGAGREDSRSLRRRGPFRDPLPVILVVCEGKVTEPEYIEQFRLAHGVTTVRVHVVAPGGDPKALVQRAIEMRNEASREARRTRDMNAAYASEHEGASVAVPQRNGPLAGRGQARQPRVAAHEPAKRLGPRGDDGQPVGEVAVAVGRGGVPSGPAGCARWTGWA